MKLDDIEKTSASSLKKGITTNRVVNPLMPDYKYPQWVFIVFDDSFQNDSSNK